jgi:hypothetical protein
MAQKGQLAIPDVAGRHAKSFKILRLWIADHNQQVSLRGGVWEDPAAWGLMLAQHLVNTYQPFTGQPIRQGLTASRKSR